ncbi:MAG: class I SAM-dependent RNA methyltransferase [Ilumatobacteraceae bacterium]
MRLTLRPERLVAGGDALARDGDGRVVFVRGALPGELVSAEITSAKKDFARAEVAEIVEPSADRVHPPCAHRREGCGGCGWMHLAPAAQLDAKVEIVRESLRRIGRIDAAEVDRLVVAGAAVDPTAYRTTIRVVGSSDRSPGYREAASDAVVPVDDCLVAHPALSGVLAEVRVAPGVELALRVSAATEAMTARWEGGRGVVDGLPPAVHVGDRAWLSEIVAGTELRVSAPSFFQSGPQAAELLVATVGRHAPELAGARHVVDAYGGVGLFAATVMAEAAHVTLLESSDSACADAERNLAGRDATVVRGEVGRWAPAEGPVDVVVADPARPGLGRPGVTALTAPDPAVLLLVSCDPVSLARDSRLLAEQGYVPRVIEVFDLAPQTAHVEVVTRFEKAI